MNAIELFAGVGGFRIGLENNNIKVIYSNEFDRYAADTYDKNFSLEGDKIDRRDITTVPTTDIPDHDLLVGGFPCQAFSVAGKRHGFNETRGTLFFDVARILKDKRPGHFILENVKGLLSHDGGKTIQVIAGVLTDLGYRIEWQVLNSKDYGVPQNRERIYIVGHLGNECAGQVFPLGENDGLHNEAGKSEGTQPQAQLSTTVRIGMESKADGTFIQQLNNPVHSNNRICADSGLSPTLNTAQGGNRQPKIVTGQPKYGNGERSVEYTESDIVPTIRATHHKNGDNQPRVITRQPLRFLQRNQKNIEGDYSFTVDAGQTSGVRVDTRIRRLTPVECERLQGFPDGWTDGVSDTQRYKQMGNAVTTNVVDAVAGKLVSECVLQ